MDIAAFHDQDHSLVTFDGVDILRTCTRIEGRRIENVSDSSKLGRLHISSTRLRPNFRKTLGSNFQGA